MIYSGLVASYGIEALNLNKSVKKILTASHTTLYFH